MRKIFFSFFIFCFINTSAQNVSQKINNALNNFLNDAQLKHAVVGLYVTDENGNKIFALNEQYGLAPASTQKIFTSAAAFALLGKDYTYKTEIGYNGTITDGILNGDLFIKGYGDPSFGSWRYNRTKPEAVFNFINNTIKNAGIKKIDGNIILDDGAFSYQALPVGYPWGDLGNYYGAGSWSINWQENQYDLVLKPGRNIGDTSTIIKIDPPVITNDYSNFITTAAENTGDNTLLYLAPYGDKAFAEGTIPKGVKDFTVSGAVGYAADQFKAELSSFLLKQKIDVSGEIITGASLIRKDVNIPSAQKNIGTYNSPALDSLAYWFLHKSINLYGECLAKTIALNNNEFASTENGVSDLKKFWQQNGIDSSELNIYDGSGLSPQNRVTTHALVQALLYAQKQNWYKSFYEALPVYNNMKIKSGTINSCRAFAGYHTAANGKKYVLAIIVNNYDSNKGSVTSKIFKVLDTLK